MTLHLQHIAMALGPIKAAIKWIRGDLSLGVKRLGRKVDHSPQPSAEVNNAWS